MASCRLFVWNTGPSDIKNKITGQRKTVKYDYIIPKFNLLKLYFIFYTQTGYIVLLASLLLQNNDSQIKTIECSDYVRIIILLKSILREIDSKHELCSQQRLGLPACTG